MAPAEHSLVAVRVNKVNGRIRVGAPEIVTVVCLCEWESAECATEGEARVLYESHLAEVAQVVADQS